MIVTSEDEEFDALSARYAQENAPRFKYGVNIWERYTDNDNVFFVLVPHRKSRSSLPPHKELPNMEDYYGPINE